MGNIVTPDQGLLPLPAYSGIATTPYPWWLNTALAIWALLALICCWLLLLLYLLRYCCRWCRQRKYAADRKSYRERFFGSGSAKGRQNIYVGKDQHFATAPLPPVPPYAIHDGNEVTFRDIHERRIVQDDFYGDINPYVTAAAIGADNDAFESGSEFISEEEIRSHDINKKSNDVRLLANGRHPITVVSDKTSSGIKENIETNIQRNITKNFYINEEQNYFIQKEPLIETSNFLHDQEIQRLPGPTVTTVNMAAERITDNPNWENVNVKEDIGDQNPKKASSEMVINDPSLFEQDVKYEKQPNIYTHRPVSPDIPRVQNKKLGKQSSKISDDGSTTSEMSGHDSESIYETIRVFTPRKQPLPPLADEDEYKTAGVDEVEFEIKDLVRLQQANAQNSGAYDDILLSKSISRQHHTPLVSSLSSSSTLNNLMPTNSQQDRRNVVSGEEEKEETVTETIKTQQIQTTFHQIGQHLDDSAFFIPLASSIKYHQGQQNDDRKIIIPVSASSVSHEEKPALEHF
ncbi:unnamed protein product [Rotaria sp. Silwood1]|nr:unnamed protein product [Rotaria sp. Silwood1]CAF3469725.1 unnamed protein product [Rotaria sp. Silwood1]CAF4782955.1 unnamed protein product [Rotaria sp. Silwood1]CAF4876858.1 unnamed protein product [Rotaria sp. Silwood1]CAF5050814.1 unnamed protein product [Rotaria sp. Silwood1]